MKRIGIILIILGSVFALTRGGMRLYANWEYENSVENYWVLADRASTISQKAEYIDYFANELRKSNLNGINANLIWKTKATSFDENFKALTSLRDRLNAISGMDENSLAYQTALQQITSQEQGEAKSMLDNFEECWTRVNYYTLWNVLIFWGFLILQLATIIFGYAMTAADE